MHNVNVSALKCTIEAAREKPEQARQQLELGGAWNAGTGPQFHATIPYPGGEVAFQADFPPMMGGSGSAPNPLAYCFWGGLACYAMTFAQEAALHRAPARELRQRDDLRAGRPHGHGRRRAARSVQGCRVVAGGGACQPRQSVRSVGRRRDDEIAVRDPRVGKGRILGG